MKAPLRLENAIYVGSPIVWGCLISSSLVTGAALFFVAIMTLPIVVCGAIYITQRIRKHSFHWQRWFFWIGLSIITLEAVAPIVYKLEIG